ncbi:MAG: M23 family metallopeptidase [Actinobacteria bacterium]|nr:MAG: M23 family metallopeptidase [Actinomycetota bacterium]
MRRLAVVLLCVLAVPASARAWTWPADGPVLRPFAFDPAHPYAGGQHRGIDIGVSEGTSVRAPADGTVTFAGSVPGGGKTIAIETPFGYSATLLHLAPSSVGRRSRRARWSELPAPNRSSTSGCACPRTRRATSTHCCFCLRASNRRRWRRMRPRRPSPRP